ncbi:MAG: hypothetical protein R3B70_39500 [Polyangiaceae bacterium]
MSIAKVAVLRAPLETLVKGLSPSDMAPAPPSEIFGAYQGENGAVLYGATLGGGALVAPFGVFDSADDLALAVRGALGPALDHHTDERGMFVYGGESLPTGTYDDAVAGAGEFVKVPAKDDPRLARGAGWSFAAAAGAFGSLDAKKRVEEHAEEDPLASAQATLDAKIAAREERGSLRRTLSAALNHEIAHSALGHAVLEGEAAAEGEAADKLRRAVAASPDKVTEMENALRGAVDSEIARQEDIDESQLPPPVVADVEGIDVTDEGAKKAP